MDLSRLVDSVADAIGETRPRVGQPLRLGVGDAAKAAAVAALARDAQGPVLVIVPKQTRAGDLHEELAAWLGPDAARRLRLYPQRDVMPYERAEDDPWDVRSRMETTASVHGDGRPIVIASVEGVAQRTLSPDAAQAALSRISKGDRLTPDELLRR